MKLLAPVLLLSALLFSGAVGAGTLQPSNVPVVVPCGYTVKVTDVEDGQTLVLDPTDPIVSGAPCPGNGISLKNGGKDSLDRTFMLDCNGAGTITGSNTGTGIRIKGPGITVVGCTVSGFATGVYASGDGQTVQDTTVQDCVGNGFDIRDPLKTTSDKFSGTFIDSDQAVDNGGFGFVLKGNGFSLDDSGDVFLTSLALRNLRGGFSLKGRGNTVTGCDAIDNGGPGFAISDKSCCGDASFDSSRAIGNAGPGVLFVGRDDGSNCIGASCYPAGVDLSDSGTGLFVLGNGGQCPKGTASYSGDPSGAICLAVKVCSDGELNRC